ncbi:hypothetical protein H072_5357 [Dactylellina haptotyla CBS 200.50]|uniref:Protein kinase domain-containing protein n=1 Tax=Dactylellina haptotyla (strain CBS 200.50) TaxID=1284197 RepID=S8ACP4_DACHA|nr:hypothetical protein H072_5357 [Dactylellina haptotyla CBS 200.50]
MAAPHPMYLLASSDDFTDSTASSNTGTQTSRGNKSGEAKNLDKQFSTFAPFTRFIGTVANSDIEIIEPGEIDETNGRYLGEGAVIRTSEARWRGKAVAVKRLRVTAPGPEVSDSVHQKQIDSQIETICQEISLMSYFPLRTHRNIVDLFAISWEEIHTSVALEFRPIMVVELADKVYPTLDMLIEAEIIPTYDISQKAFLISDILAAISFVHEHVILHGDIKPENILLFSDGLPRLTAKLSDFGFSNKRLLDKAGALGTSSWAPSEYHDGTEIPLQHIFGAGQETARDVYSFGLVASYILLGKHFPKLQQGNENHVENAMMTSISTALRKTYTPCPLTEESRDEYMAKLRSDWHDPKYSEMIDLMKKHCDPGKLERRAWRVGLTDGIFKYGPSLDDSGAYLYSPNLETNNPEDTAFYSSGFIRYSPGSDQGLPSNTLDLIPETMRDVTRMRLEREIQPLYMFPEVQVQLFYILLHSGIGPAESLFLANLSSTIAKWRTTVLATVHIEERLKNIKIEEGSSQDEMRRPTGNQFGNADISVVESWVKRQIPRSGVIDTVKETLRINTEAASLSTSSYRSLLLDFASFYDNFEKFECNFWPQPQFPDNSVAAGILDAVISVWDEERPSSLNKLLEFVTPLSAMISEDDATSIFVFIAERKQLKLVKTLSSPALKGKFNNLEACSLALEHPSVLSDEKVMYTIVSVSRILSTLYNSTSFLRNVFFSCRDKDLISSMYTILNHLGEGATEGNGKDDHNVASVFSKMASTDEITHAQQLPRGTRLDWIPTKAPLELPAIHCAVASNNYIAFDYFIEHSKVIDVWCCAGKFHLLHFVTGMCRSLMLARLLSASNLDLNIRTRGDDSGQTCLHILCSNRLMAVINEVAVAHFPYFGRYFANWAPELTDIHRTACISILLSRGADIINARDEEGMTPVLYSVETGQVEIFETIKRDDACDITATNFKGWNVLHLAARRGDEEIMNCCLQDDRIVKLVDQRDEAGHTPLLAAVNRAHYPVARQLISTGADISITDAFGVSLLQVSIRGGIPAASLGFLEYLLGRDKQQTKTLCHQRNKFGRNALHELADIPVTYNSEDKERQAALVNLILDLCELDEIEELLLPDKAGLTPLDLAVLHKSDGIFKIIESKATIQSSIVWNDSGVQFNDQRLDKHLIDPDFLQESENSDELVEQFYERMDIHHWTHLYLPAIESDILSRAIRYSISLETEEYKKLEAILQRIERNRNSFHITDTIQTGKETNIHTHVQPPTDSEGDVRATLEAAYLGTFYLRLNDITFGKEDEYTQSLSERQLQRAQKPHTKCEKMRKVNICHINAITSHPKFKSDSQQGFKSNTGTPSSVPSVFAIRKGEVSIKALSGYYTAKAIREIFPLEEDQWWWGVNIFDEEKLDDDTKKALSENFVWISPDAGLEEKMWTCDELFDADDRDFETGLAALLPKKGITERETKIDGLREVYQTKRLVSKIRDARKKFQLDWLDGIYELRREFVNIGSEDPEKAASDAEGESNEADNLTGLQIHI